VFFTPKIPRDYNSFMTVTINGTKPPETVTYQKKGDFYRVHNYNMRFRNDEIPLLA
jgi:hypothetical protein